MTVLRAATPPATGVGRPPLAFGVLGLLVGMILAYLLIFLIEVLLDGRLYTAGGIERSTELPVLTSLPGYRRGRAIAADPLIVLHANLDITIDVAAQSTLLVTGAARSDDTATAAMALAENFARRGMRTLLIDADLKRPELARRYRVAGSDNLSLLRSARGKSGARRPATVEVDGGHEISLVYEPKGGAVASADMLRAVGHCIEQWKEDYGAIVVRTSALRDGSDALLLAQYCSGTILAIGPRRSNRRRVLGAVAHLRKANVMLMGAIATGMAGRAGARRTATRITYVDVNPASAPPRAQANRPPTL